MDFSEIGILAKISTVLADNKISIFAVSTYNTDYILVKKDSMNKAVEVLKQTKGINKWQLKYMELVLTAHKVQIP